MNCTNEICLGGKCRFYYERPDATCFHLGVLPHCGPELKNKRKKLDDAAPELYEALQSLPWPEFKVIDGNEYMVIPYAKFAKWDVEEKCKAIAKAEGGKQ